MNTTKYKLENCANCAQSAQNAQLAGARRVELCAGMPEGGTTPSYGEIRKARELISIDLYVIIRPRGGDFCYTEVEEQAMHYDIEMAKSLGVDGLVFGCLTPDGDIDVPMMRRLMKTAGDTPVTFHRAIDVCRDMNLALEILIALGCERVLTSGGAQTALEGADKIAELVAQARDRIIVMPGSGVDASNIVELAERTGAAEFHLSARSQYDSQMRYRHAGVSMGGTVQIDEFKYTLTDRYKIFQVLSNLSKLDTSEKA